MPEPTDLPKLIASLPAELRPLTPVLTPDAARNAALNCGACEGGGDPADFWNAAFRHAHNYATAMTQWTVRLAETIVATNATPAPVPLRFGSCDCCGGHLLSAAEADRGRCPICEHYGLEPSPADADLSLAAASFRMAGSPFADPRANIPARVPVAVHSYAPDMSTGTYSGEAAGAALDDIFAPKAERARAALAWQDIDREPEETASCVTATSIKVQLAEMKDRMDAHREAANIIG